MSVPSGVIVAWPGAASAIPSGWSRVTSLDSRYVKGAAAAAEPDETGGSATHTHTSPGHTHSIPSHSHGGGTTNASASVSIDSDQTAVWTHNHTHTFGTSGANTGTSSSTVGTWNTASNDPPYVTVIFIVSGGSTDGVADGAWAWWPSETLPDDWSQPPAAKNNYLKGAPAVGDGGATGGSTTHSHTAAGHTHVWNGHTHTGGTTGSSTGSTVTTEGGYGSYSMTNLTSAHTHSWSLSGGATAGNSATSADTGTATDVEPPHHTLAVIENETGGDDLPGGLIAAWLGLISAVPSGWALCDGEGGTPDLRGWFVKGADELSEIGDTGGALGHDHSDPAGHTHPYDHIHAASVAAASDFPTSAPGGGVAMGYQHTHLGNSATATGTSGSGVQTVDANADSQPPFRTVLFIQFQVQLDVTITEPEAEGTISQPGFDVAWDAEVEGSPITQNDYRVRIYDEAQTEVLYDSGQTASASQEHTVGSWAPANNTDYYLVVDVTDTDNTIGSSGFHPFTTSWMPPATITGLTVTPVGGVL